MNPAYLSAISALAGSAIGALASFATTWLTQHYQNRAQRRAQEDARREKLYGDFIDEASKQLASALTNSLDDPVRLVPLYAILGKMRLFASTATITSADTVIRQIIELYYSPNEDFGSRTALNSHKLDVLHGFTIASRDDLMRR